MTKACHICGARIPSRGWGFRNHMVAHVKAREAVILRTGGERVTLGEYNKRRAGDQFTFAKSQPLLEVQP